MQDLKIIHYPNLKTVLMVEDILQKANILMTREQLKKNLPTKIMHQTLNVILKYLEDSGKILDRRKGILGIYNPSPKLDKAVKGGDITSFLSKIKKYILHHRNVYIL